MVSKNIIIFKNLTEGFMNLDGINYLADIFSKDESLKNRFTFILDNEVSNESNQAIMQMFNKLIGFDIFEAASSKGQLLEYKELNQLQLRNEIKANNISLDEFLDSKYKNSNIKKHIVEKNIYESILTIIKGELECLY